MHTKELLGASPVKVHLCKVGCILSFSKQAIMVLLFGIFSFFCKCTRETKGIKRELLSTVTLHIKSLIGTIGTIELQYQYLRTVRKEELEAGILALEVPVLPCHVSPCFSPCCIRSHKVSTPTAELGDFLLSQVYIKTWGLENASLFCTFLLRRPHTKHISKPAWPPEMAASGRTRCALLVNCDQNSYHGPATC